MTAGRIEIPAREGRAVRVAAGRSVRVVDVAGGQVGDLFAFCADDLGERLSAEHTRAELFRLFPRVGQSFWSNRRRPLLLFEADSSPGFHDMLFAACDDARYARLGAPAGHASCAANLQTALAALGLGPVAVPQPVNLFEHIPPLADGTLDWRETASAAGDHVQLRAERDCVIVVSACPYDLVAGGRDPGPLALELL
ncbi:MAG TPA: urea carboxylase-associated family protein [Gaiellales bacterium]